MRVYEGEMRLAYFTPGVRQWTRSESDACRLPSCRGTGWLKNSWAMRASARKRSRTWRSWLPVNTHDVMWSSQRKALLHFVAVCVALGVCAWVWDL